MGGFPSPSRVMRSQIRLGTRGSALALSQARLVQATLRTRFPDCDFDSLVIKTSGDIDLKSPLSEIGGKGVFIREIEQALSDGKIDIAVHSHKDVTVAVLPGLELAGFLRAETTADALVLKADHTLDTLPKGAVLATGSMRRKALLKKMRPDIQTVGIRGN